MSRVTFRNLAAAASAVVLLALVWASTVELARSDVRQGVIVPDIGVDLVAVVQVPGQPPVQFHPSLSCSDISSTTKCKAAMKDKCAGHGGNKGDAKWDITQMTCSQLCGDGTFYWLACLNTPPK